MISRTKAPMSKPRSPALTRVALLALALASVTCSDDGDVGTGTVSGEVYLSEPVEGATVTVNRWDGGVVGAEVCRAATDAAGHYECLSGKYFGPMLVTATGGRTTEQGAGVTLPAGSVLRAPLLDLQPQQQRTIHLNPATDLIVTLGVARAAAGQDADIAAAVTHAHELVRAHLDADPVTVAPKGIDAPTAFDESARVALVLRGLGEYAHLAAVDQAVTVQAVNTRVLLDQLVRDASSAEARLDGNGAEVLSIGPACPLLAGCSMEQLGCYASCHIYSNSMRSRLGAAILSWLRTPANGTGLDKTDVLAWVTAMKDNLEPQLFGSEGTEPFDEVGPAVDWASPAAAQVFTSGAVAIDVTASDALGVASLAVIAQLGTPVTITDTDPSPERVVASLPLAGLPEGPLVLLAIARDTDGNQTDAPRSIELNLVAGGTISGLAFKARLAGATVTAYRFTNGVRGAAVGSTTTGADGAFVNLSIADGTTGALLLETTGGTYAEDSQPATAVTLDVTETLRTVVPNYADGAAISSVVISPLTTLAEAYLAYLTSAATGGADVSTRWTTATGAIEAHFGVANIRDITPSAPAQVDTLAAPDRYGLVLIGLSRLAWAASSSGGGDAGAFGPAVNAQTITRTWGRDLGDGCWDGRAGATTLTYGGTLALTEEASRLHLAQAIVAYLGDSARNQTAFASAADVLPLLDTLATGGTTTAPGACPGGRVFTTPGDTFDRTGPVVTWTQLPPSLDVRGSFMIAATCADALDPNPILAIASPAGTVDQDGDITNHNIRASFDTTALPDGPLAVIVDGLDASGNHSDVATSTRNFLVDNTAPVVSITAPATNGLFLRPPVTLGWTVVEANLASTTATLDGATIVSPGFQVAAEGAHALAVSVTDRAGGSASATRTFTIDSTAPVLSVTAPAHGSFIRGPVVLSWSVTDANPGTTVTATLDGAAFASGGSINAEGAHTLVVTATDAAGNTAATVTRTFTIDNTPPVLTVAAISGFVRGPVTLTFSATDNFPPPATTATLDGTGFSSGGQVNTEGAHTLVVNAVDQAGNTAPTITRTFTLDNTAPGITSVVAPAGAVVKPPLTITATAIDNLMVMGSLGADIAVTSSPTPTTTTPGSSGGNRTLAVTYAALADGPFTVRFNVVDRAGNTANEHTVTRTIDGTAPTLSWPMTPIGADYWTTTATPTLTGTVTDANLASVIVSWPGGSVAATAAGGMWTATVPASANLDLAGKDLTVTAADLAGNTTAITRRLRADVTPPVVGFVDEQIRDESKDAIAFDTSVDATYGKPKLNPSHTHSTTAPNTTTLGPNVACTLGTTPVTKYAYLLDEAPLYGSHVNDPVVDGDNALRWTVAPSDDGVGLASTRYRVVNVATSAVLLDWTTLPTTTTTTVPLRRVGVTSPSIPLLGTSQGLLRIEFEVTDQLNRITAATRCWDQRLLAAPIYLGGAATLPVTDAAANAAGQYSLAGLTLDSTAPAMPVSMMLATNALGGAGLFEFPIYNPTNETIYLSIDLDLPSGATWSKTYYNNKWVYRDVATNTNCGSTGSTGEWEPDIDLPGCGLTNPTGGTPGSQMASGAVPTTDYGIRVWTGNQISSTLTELTQCAGCNTTPAAAQRTRITVQLPPRGTGANPPPPVEVQILPVLRPNTNYQPAGSATEFTVAGTPTSFTLTGAATATATRCLAWNLPVPYTGASAPTYRCTSTRNFTQVRYLKSVTVGSLLQMTAYAFTGVAGTAPSQPAHLMGSANARSYLPPNPVWNTSELSEPPAL